MALNFDLKGISEGLAKGAADAKEALSAVAEVTADKASAAANVAGTAIATGAATASEVASAVIKDQQEKWYSPIFLEDYQAEDFDMPKLVVVTDEDKRKGNEICKGAIGWLNTRRVPEIIFMYEEFVPKSGIRFNPRPMCGAAYYRHPFERDLYLQVKDYINICRQDQLTELKNIACMLGAVHCCVEIHQEKGIIGTLGATRSSNARNVIDKEKASASASQTVTADCTANETLSIAMNESFEPGAVSQHPELKWFAHDNEILSLIEKRCNPNAGGVLNSYSIDITSSTSASVSVGLAQSIDTSLGLAHVKTGDTLTAGLKREEKKHFIYKIEFK